MLDLNPDLMLFVLVIFFSLMYLLNRMLYQPLLKFMDDRDATIANDLKNAKEMADNSSDLNVKADIYLVEARAKANAIREKATSEAKALAESKIESKTAEVDVRFAAFEAELEAEQKILKNALTAALPAYKETLRTKLSSL